jgi:hypothetical protein
MLERVVPELARRLRFLQALLPGLVMMEVRFLSWVARVLFPRGGRRL